MQPVEKIEIKNYSLFSKLIDLDLNRENLTYVASAENDLVVRCYVKYTGILYEINNGDFKMTPGKLHKFINRHAMGLIEDSRTRSYCYYIFFEEDLKENQTYKIYDGFRWGSKEVRGFVRNYICKNESLVEDSKKVIWFA